MLDLAEPDTLPDKIDRLLTHHNALRKGLGVEQIDPQTLLDELTSVAPKILPFVDATWRCLDEARKEGKRVLFEGAQGTLLDIDHGTYPTEQDNAVGAFLGERGHEFGTVTGRKRRCGWFDAVLVRQAVATGGITGLALTKLDVLDGLDELKICVRYRLDGEEIDHLPASQAAQSRVEPVYETIEGWKATTAGARKWADLPAQAVKYVRHVEELVGAPIALLSTSPERDDTILVEDPFRG